MTSIHTFAILPLIRGLHNLVSILEKARASSLDESTILAARTHPDMLAFPWQIFLVARVAGDLPSQLNPALPKNPCGPLEENPTLESLLERARTTIAFLESDIKPEDLNGRENERVSFTYGKGEGAFGAEYDGAAEYVGLHSHPNFWFHYATAYNLLRGCGLDIGKRNFLNGAGLHEWNPVEA